MMANTEKTEEKAVLLTLSGLVSKTVYTARTVVGNHTHSTPRKFPETDISKNMQNFCYTLLN